MIAAACCALHNLLTNERCTSYITAASTDRCGPDGETIDGEFFSAGERWDSIPRTQRGRPNESCIQIRERLARHFCGVGALDWQFLRANCTPNEN